MRKFKTNVSIWLNSYNGYREPLIKTRFGSVRNWVSRCEGAHTHASSAVFLKANMQPSLKSCYKKAHGITLGGTKTVYSKGWSVKRSNISYATTLSNMSYFTMPLSIVKDTATLNIAVLTLTADGACQYVRATRKMKLLRVQLAARFLEIALLVGTNTQIIGKTCFDIVALLKVQTLISSVALAATSKIKYARAGGTFCEIVGFVKNTQTRIALIKLPSMRLRAIDGLVVVAIGANVLKIKKTLKNSPAGYWRRLGHKPSVRGVVKNPVDHPHGGREKTVLWPRTPWGKTAK